MRRHLRRGHLPVDHLTVQQHLEASAQRRWAEIGSPATEWLSGEARTAQATLEAGAATLASGRTVTVGQLLRACRVVREIRALARAEQDRQRPVDQVVDDLLRVLDIVGEVAGADLRDEVVARCVERKDPVFTVTTGRFADLREAAASSCQRRSA